MKPHYSDGPEAAKMNAVGVVPPFAAALIGYAFGPSRVRGLTRPEVHETFLFEELLPRLEFRAREIVLIGQSLGGRAGIGDALAALLGS